jgi:hypothetical protein
MHVFWKWTNAPAIFILPAKLTKAIARIGGH